MPIKLDQNDTRIAEIGITISHLEQKKGYAKEVLTGVLSFLFDTKRLHRVVEIVDAENTAAINLLKSKKGILVKMYFSKENGEVNFNMPC